MSNDMVRESLRALIRAWEGERAQHAEMAAECDSESRNGSVEIDMHNEAARVYARCAKELGEALARLDFAEEAERQAKLLRGSPEEKEAMDFIESAFEWPEDEARSD